MTVGPSPRTVNRSPDGDGLTECDGPPGHPRIAGRVHGMPDEVPDAPLHLPLDADRVLRPDTRSGPGAAEEAHVMPCDGGRTGQTPSCEHSGTRTDHHRGRS